MTETNERRVGRLKRVTQEGTRLKGLGCGRDWRGQEWRQKRRLYHQGWKENLKNDQLRRELKVLIFLQHAQFLKQTRTLK